MTVASVRVLQWQAEFLSWQDAVAGVVGGLGSGKTFIACCWFIDRVMQYPEGRHVVVGKDLPQLKRGTLVSLKQALNDRNIDYTYNSTNGFVTIIENGCIIEAMGAGNYLAFRSLEADTIWADELADWGPSGETAFIQYLSPRLRASPRGKKYTVENGGTMNVQLRFSSNPPLSTTHWLYQLIEIRKYCRCLNVSLRKNFLMGKEALAQYVDRQERAMPQNLWPILIDGEWGNATVGNVYRTFNRKRHCTRPELPLAPLVYNPRLPILWTLDFNVNLMCSVICQLHNQLRVEDPSYVPPVHLPVQSFQARRKVLVPGYQASILYVLKEIRMPGGTPDVAEEFIKLYRKNGWQQRVVLYGDASGGGKSQQLSARNSARSNWAIVYQMLTGAGIQVELRIQSGNPPVLDRTNAVNAQLGTKGDDTGLLLDELNAPYTATDLATVDWKQDGSNDIDKDDPNLTHLSDALGYLIWVERALASRVKFNLKQVMEL